MSESPTAGPPVVARRAARRRAVGLALGVLLAVAVVARLQWMGERLRPLVAVPDEGMHAATVAVACREPLRLLDAERLEFQDAAGAGTGLHLPSHHPPAYAWGAALLAGAACRDVAPAELVPAVRRRLRPLVAAVLLGGLALGFRLARGTAGRWLWGAALLSQPMLWLTLAGLNNDALAIAGGWTVLAGLALLGSRPRLALAAVGLGVLAATCAKLTAALLALGAVGLYALLGWRRQRPAAVRLLLVAALASLPAALFYAAETARWGTPVPGLEEYAPREVQLYFPVADRRLPLGEYAVHFVRQLVASAVNAYSATNAMEMRSPLVGTGFLVLALLAAGGLLRARDADRRLLLASAGAVLAVFALHFAWARGHHLATGHLGAAQYRYYLPLLPAGLLAAVRGLESLPAAVRPWLAGVTGLLLLYADPVRLLLEIDTLGW